MVSRQDKWEKLKLKVQRKGLYGANRHNTSVTLWMLEDLETGINVNREKGSRSAGRLITLVRRMSTLTYLVEKKYGHNKKITELSEREVLKMFNQVRSGELKSKRGKRLKDVASIAETFSQFWRWWVTVNKKRGEIIPDIVESLDTTNDYKPSWVLLSEKQLKELAEHCSPSYKALVWFCIDSGVRPQELQEIKREDISEDDNGVLWLDLRQEVAKKGSFGRRIKLLVCDELLKLHIERKDLQPDDHLFTKSNEAAKKYLRRRAISLFGEGKTLARGSYKDISLYDLRHNSAVYWRQRYKNFNSYIYRLGWKNPSRAFYYDEFLNHKDSLEESDLIVNASASKLEKHLTEERKKRELVEEQLLQMQKQMQEMQQAMEINSYVEKAQEINYLADNLNSISTSSIDADAENHEPDSK